MEYCLEAKPESGLIWKPYKQKLESMMKPTVTRFVRFYLVALAIALLLGNVDYELSKRTGHTWLSLPIAFYTDGGSTESLGFGYTLKCRHKIHRRENDRTYYLVGPELKGWNIFQVFGARRLFERDYGDEVYYPDGDRSKPVVQGSIAGDMIGQKVLSAVIDLFPLMALFGLFALWNKITNRKRIPTAKSTLSSESRADAPSSRKVT